MQPNRVIVYIHTKDESRTPKYFYAVDGVPVREGEKIKDLDFNKDILGVKFDLMNTEVIAESFLTAYFKKLERELKIEAKNIYIGITTLEQGHKFKEIKAAVFEGSKLVKNIEIADLFGGE